MSFDITVNLAKNEIADGLQSSLRALNAELPAAIRRVKSLRERGLPHFKLPTAVDDLPEIERLATHLTQGADHVVVFGIGGSSLGGQALAQLSGWGTPAYEPKPKRPSVHFVENLDGHTLNGVLSRLDLRRTRFLAISKSGGTAETLSQAIIAIEALKRLAQDTNPAAHFAMITEASPNPLRRLGEIIGCPIGVHDAALGGRYSALSLVGLTPARIMGLDIAALRNGAAEILATLDRDAVQTHWAQGAALSVAAMKNGLAQTVMWAYSDQLERLIMWWRQLWGESLGKGGHGSTPIRALGPVDQHSQLQLYLDGPKDKLFTILTVGDGDNSPMVSQNWANKIGQSMIGGKSPTQIVNAQARATVETLISTGRPVRTIHIPKLNEHSLGALMMHFMLETLVAAELLSVDPFDQPAVEQGKILTKKYLTADV